MYSASVVADSISPEGHRITTVRAIYPHAVHKDMLRHRCMNRNVESFRAQPPEKLIEALRNGHAFKPDVFAKRTKGMGQDSEEIAESEVALHAWLLHVERTCDLAEDFIKLDVAKQQVNFLLQDLCPLTEVITATDWSNFYALRTELRDDGTPVARPEVYKAAVAIKDAIESSTPVDRDLHLPMLTSEELEKAALYPVEQPMWFGVSAGRCARISYGDYRWWEEDPLESFARHRRILDQGHMSPSEQQARCFSSERWDVIQEQQADIAKSLQLSKVERDEICRQLEYSGNLHGWVPARKSMPNEWDYGLLQQAVSA